jgi:hypothetical protein
MHTYAQHLRGQARDWIARARSFTDREVRRDAVRIARDWQRMFLNELRRVA